ncbi:Cytosolic phospholipase A2 zeta [Collichthys lucidus]|uniref:Cytosolic phospholipase A2 zeta n=1 Tax=Collichthys lucidus TaxID=240159 RepID=A0A4U5VUG2_COLLU|nr:Cytosolic phospholipase A2 zeta [Collichthys lucidus]
MKGLNSLGVDCIAKNVPHIALLGSGGGQRADVGFMGTLYQMEKEGLLDTLVYVGGISGSTWCMSSVYNDPEWSSKMDRAMSRLFRPGIELKQILDWLYKQMNDEDFSLSDVWGALTSAKFIKEMDQRHLSDEARRNTFNPYPIYNAVNKDCFTHGPTEGKWFELSPHEAGFTELGFFIETSLLGNKFKDGELVEKKPEMDMVKLEGIFGSALASWEVIKEYILNWLKVKLVGKIGRLIMDWEWGTTENFLYHDRTAPTYLSSKERFHLMDAGLLMNVPYPVFLGEKRDIDLIIAPDYSAGKAFETLTLARDYAAEVKKPFPEIDDKILKERDCPNDCYVFEGKEKEPTIVYMPLFNRRNCKDAEEVKAKMDEFSTFHRPYNKEQIESLLEIVKANVTHNKGTLLKEINKAVRRREEK